MSYLIDRFRIKKTIEDMRTEEEKEWDKEVVEVEEDEDTQDATGA